MARSRFVLFCWSCCATPLAAVPAENLRKMEGTVALLGCYAAPVVFKKPSEAGAKQAQRQLSHAQRAALVFDKQPTGGSSLLPRGRWAAL
ncbi:hypothetical protein [Shimia sp.]|uniref:hypothetical protein n=1 Tax=Shimia sp. TaxID=1954381 RepID=UPI003B8E2828